MNRRRFLIGSGIACAVSGKSFSGQGTKAKSLKVVVVGGHPGDPEYGCGGTIARYVERKDQVTMLYLNRGEKGCSQRSSQECADIRSTEAKNAAKVLGTSAMFADQIDGESVVSPGAYDKFFTLVQAEAPDVVFAPWPIDNHRDHRAASNLAYDAWLRAKKSFGLYFYEASTGEDTVMFSPTDFVDIEKVEAKKRSACFAHASQSPERFYALQTEISRFRGIESGCRLAEAFVRHRESVGYLLP